MRRNLVPLAILKQGSVDDVRYDAGVMAVTPENSLKVCRRDGDRVNESQERSDDRAPSREMVVGFTAMVMEHNRFVKEPCGDDRRNGCQHERPVRGRKN